MGRRRDGARRGVADTSTARGCGTFDTMRSRMSSTMNEMSVYSPVASVPSSPPAASSESSCSLASLPRSARNGRSWLCNVAASAPLVTLQMSALGMNSKQKSAGICATKNEHTETLKCVESSDV